MVDTHNTICLPADLTNDTEGTIANDIERFVKLKR